MSWGKMSWGDLYWLLREKEKKFGTPLLCFLLGAAAGIVTATYELKPLAYAFIALAAAALVFDIVHLALAVRSSS